MRFHAAITLAACLAPAAAIFEDDAYHIDFHYALLGLPKHEATFFQKPYAGSKASLLYSISQNQTIGAVNPKDGALVWRQHFSAAPHGQGHLRAGHEQDTVVSAVGDRIAAWGASDGRLVWETSLGGATVEDLEILEQEDGMTINEAKDAVVLLSGASNGVKRLDGKTGQAKWTFEDTRLAIPTRIMRRRLTMHQWRHSLPDFHFANDYLLHFAPHVYARRVQTEGHVPQSNYGKEDRPIHAEL
jgi:outer membrane protein assembly factor BamB